MRRTVEKPSTEIHQIAEQRQHANDDHDDAHDLLGAAVDRQHVDEIKHKQNDHEGDERSNENVHANPNLNREESCCRRSGATSLAR
jgi:hypothetical protein